MEYWKDALSKHIFSEASQSDIQMILKEKRAHIPTRLFKYREFNENNLESLRNSTTWCAAAATFNDPYDSSITLFWSPQDLNDLFIKGLFLTPQYGLPEPDPEMVKRVKQASDPETEYIKILCERDSSQNFEQSTKAMKWAKGLVMEQFKKGVQLVNQILKHEYQISCFCQNLNSMPMWYHYADKYRGFVIEYNFVDSDKYDSILSNLWPVIYSEKLFDMTPFLKPVFDNKPKNELLPIFACISKSIDWAYEKEWRLIIENKSSDKGMLYPIPKANAVYIGKDTSAKNREKLLKIATSIDIAAYEMDLSTSIFEMVPRPLKSIKKI